MLSSDGKFTSCIPKKAGQTDGAENVPLGQFSKRSLDFQQANRTNRMWRICREISAHEKNDVIEPDIWSSLGIEMRAL